MDQNYSTICPYIARMGVCLEPSACRLRHSTALKLNLNAKEWTPGTNN